MRRIILNIATSTVTTLIGIYAGRKMMKKELETEKKINRQITNIIDRTEKAVRKWWGDSQYYMTEYYMAEMKLSKLKKMLSEVQGKVEKQAEYKTERSMKDKQLEIINHYGLGKQLDQLLEESGELIVAIAKNKRYSHPSSSLDHYENLVEELADVKNLIEQIELQNPYIKEGIEVMTKHKTERELGRIRRNGQ